MTPPNSRRLLLFALCLPLLGCISRPKQLATESFSFAPALTSPPKAGGPKPALALRSVRIVPAFAAHEFVYRVADYRYERDPYARFLASPELLIRSTVSDSLQSSGRFQAVAAWGSAIATRSSIEISVRELYGDFRPGRTPAAVIALRFFLVQSLGGKLLWEQTFLRRVPLRERSPSALMRGWNEGLRQILSEVGPLLAEHAREADEAAQKAAEKTEPPPPPKTPSSAAPAPADS